MATRSDDEVHADRRGAVERGVGVISSQHRDPGDDFFCLRYRVWYPSYDCALRTKFKTCSGCLNCEQGRFNLKRHAAGLRRGRFSLPLSD